MRRRSAKRMCSRKAFPAAEVAPYFHPLHQPLVKIFGLLPSLPSLTPESQLVNTFEEFAQKTRSHHPAAYFAAPIGTCAGLARYPTKSRRSSPLNPWINPSGIIE